jgi:hypothetical protein
MRVLFRCIMYVFVVQGEVVREFMKDTDSINMYKNMRETLVYLTHLDYADTERIMTEKLQNQVAQLFLLNFLSRNLWPRKITI